MTHPSELYNKKIKSGELLLDEKQKLILPTLDELVDNIESPAKLVEYKGVMAWQGSTPKGIYLHGSVGRGKSMLMQLVFDSCSIKEKRRVHFHEFMEEIHERMHKIKPPAGVDIILQLASDIAKDAKLLYFDEFYVTSIGDAMLLGRLVEALFSCGVTLCATSNWDVEDLFQDGHNRHNFLPFISKIKKHLQIVNLDEDKDWRTHDQDKYSKDNEPFSLFEKMANSKPKQGNINLGHLELATLGNSNNIMWFDFAELCGNHLGHGEYIELCNNIKGLIISDIPHLDEQNADSAMRFVVLVDILYEKQIPFHVTSQLELKDICPIGSSPVDFAFERAVSRMHELQRLG